MLKNMKHDLLFRNVVSGNSDIYKLLRTYSKSFIFNSSLGLKLTRRFWEVLDENAIRYKVILKSQQIFFEQFGVCYVCVLKFDKNQCYADFETLQKSNTLFNFGGMLI